MGSPGAVAEWHSALPSKPEVVGLNPAETGRIFSGVLYPKGAKIVVPCKIPIALMHVKKNDAKIVAPLIMQGKIKVATRRWHMTLVALSLR